MLSGQGDPARVGRWEEPIQWPIVGIHAAVLPTGRVFHLTYLDPVTERETEATVWNPATGRFTDVSPGFGSMFCSGQSFLPSGELFIAGGYDPTNCIAQGTAETYVFDPFTSSWRETGSMRRPRFYPTVIAKPDGRQLIIGGQDEFCQYVPTMEIFHPTTGLSSVRRPNRIMRDYPRAFLLSSGEVAHVLPEATTSILDPDMKAWTSVAVTRLGRTRWEGAAFYVPGRTDNVMICGGYLDRVELEFSNPTTSCEVIDLSRAKPVWRNVRPMNFPRGDINAVLLPDGKVLVVGGGEHHRYEDPNVHPELYDPKTDTWTVLAPQRFGRMYHSTAVLLPDGRVLSAGQDDDPSDGQVSGAWGEIYRPPYLFKGRRPGIRKAPESAEYGARIKLTVRKARRIESIVLMGLSAVTHSTNVGQRYVELEFKIRSRRKVDARVPKSPNRAPPGYYMLFAVNKKGVPSVARMIRVGEGS
jgi:hypothetical protein